MSNQFEGNDFNEHQNEDVNCVYSHYTGGNAVGLVGLGF